MSKAEPEGDRKRSFSDLVADVMASQASQTDAVVKQLLAQKQALKSALDTSQERIRQLKTENQRLRDALAKTETGPENESQ